MTSRLTRIDTPFRFPGGLRFWLATLALGSLLACSSSENTNPAGAGGMGAAASGNATGTGAAFTGTGGAGPTSPAGFTCAAGQQLCGTSCVDVLVNPLHCGKCDSPCPAGTSCSNGACSCAAGLTACTSGCVDTASDVNNCGSCGNACPAGQVCSLSACSTSCAAGLTNCSDSCVDTTTSVFNCGTCGNQCAAGRHCQTGSCACDTGTDCSGVCTDTQRDPANCGTCGNTCTNSATCSAGACVGGTTGAGGTGGAGSDTTSGGTASGGDGTTGGGDGTGGEETGPVGFINAQAKVVASGNDFGMVGYWYAFSDGETSTDSGNPYVDGKYCVTGTALGDEDYSGHWGVGMGFDLNKPDPDGDKLAYEYTGKVTGFRMKLEGEAPAGVRVQFVTSEPAADVSPFLKATLGESVVYNMKDAIVPLDWGVDNYGAKVDTGSIYSIQIMIPGAEKAGAINVCLTEFEPIYDAAVGHDTSVAGSPFINSEGYIRSENNDFGIQGGVYTISDGNSTTQSGNPYKDGKYCVSGQFTGAEDDWGAGIAFDLNKAPGGGGKEAYTGSAEGFRIKLTGTSPGTVRVQYIVTEPQDGNQPFLAATLNTSMVYRTAWAQVPTSWEVDDAGKEVDTAYTLQVYLDGTTAGPFDVCIEEFEPLAAGDLTTTAQPAASGYTGARTIDEAILDGEYETWKSRHVEDCGNSACVVRDEENDCISEGIGYGMLLAVAFDDQTLFDKLWKYYTDHLGSTGFMDWSTNVCQPGAKQTGSATDGDLDVAMALIQAGCKWGGSYTGDATTLIGKIRQSEVETCSSGVMVLRPGAGFGGCNGDVNPSYFAPGYYRLFASVAGDSSWNTLANDSYTLLATAQSARNGLVPDWSDASGQPQSGDRGEYGPDATRTPWRIATDYAWNGEAKAKTFLDNMVQYLDGNGGVQRFKEPNSAYRGGAALAGLAQSSTKAQEMTDAWLETSVDDTTYFPGTLRVIFMLLAANKFPEGC